MGNDRQNKQKTWETVQAGFTSQSGVAMVVVDETGIVSKSNNNSICEMMNSSGEFARRCAMFCGRAFEEAVEAGKVVSHQCHAGLHYQALAINAGENKQLVAIAGRVFLSSEDYRKATERAIDGDWKEFVPSELFKNVLLASSAREIDQLVRRLEKLSDEDRELLLRTAEKVVESDEETKVAISEHNKLSKPNDQFQQKETQSVIERSSVRQSVEMEDLTAWRSLFGSLLYLNYREACSSVAQFLAQRYQLSSLAWLENRANILESIWECGDFARQHIQISISTEDVRLLEAYHKEASIELRERKTVESSAESKQVINLFPVAISGSIQGALAVGDELNDPNVKRRIARFMRQVASELEILRLREEIKRQTWLTKAIQKLNLVLKQVDAEDFWTILAQNSAELMRAERGSILIFDDETSKFVLKAAIGNKSDFIKNLTEVGEKVAHHVLRSGRPLVVKNMKLSGVVPAPADWKYKTDSFIIYPIIISGRKIGVLNLTDKIDGGNYDEKDLEILHALAPQIAIALDRTSLMRKAGEFEQLSMTDSLTGLLNRRYLEVRLEEEINRSQRHGYAMSFMMIDVDQFKSYNDTFTHPEGDKALQMVGQCLKATLRGADVAARYGGEEFSILLPQTTLREARTIADRLREQVEKTTFPNRQVTVSIGLATCSAELCNAKELISAADKALYEAKTKGRNRVEVYRKDSVEE